ncbi:MAG: LacI family DNA-binding transcriptional regulator, partial [Planctomycetota bacterium]
MSIAEVAERAGVSNATISRVINHHRGVSESTAASVRRAMQELGYTPPVNRPGPKVGSKRSARVTNVLFLVCLGESSRATAGFQRLVEGVSSSLEEQNANLAVKFLSNAEEVSGLNLSHPRVDGVLAHGDMPLEDVSASFAELPTVWLMSNPVRPAWGDQVMPDNDEIGRIAAKHLVDSGRNRLAYLNLLPGHWALQLHARAFRNAAQEMGVHAEAVSLPSAVSNKYCIRFDAQDSARLAEAADRLVDDLLSRQPRIDGVFIAEDAQAALLVPALQRRGVDTGP